MIGPDAVHAGLPSTGSTSRTCSIIGVTHNTVTAIYDRYRYDKEKRAALEKWAEVLFGIVDVTPAPTKAPARRASRQNVYEFTTPASQRVNAAARGDATVH